MWAVGFYGILGGFVLLAVPGAADGLPSEWTVRGDGRRQRRRTLFAAAAIAFAASLVLACLDKIIGPW